MHRALDVAGVGLATLCLVHCLVLPILAVAMPFAAQLSHAEWVHATVVALAAPAAIVAILPALAARPIPWAIPALAVAGLAAMTSALFVEAAFLETALSVMGGISLASAHLLNWRHAHLRAACKCNVCATNSDAEQPAGPRFRRTL
jgi:hypothetical protein